MQSFERIYEIAAARKGGPKALEKLIQKPKSAAALRKISDDRWLSQMTRCVFQAGFVWRVVNHKWPDFERVFNNFDPHLVAYLPDEAIDNLMTDASIIRHHTKLMATRANALFLLDLAGEYGSAAKFFADFPAESYVELLRYLKKHASRMGGTSAQYFLRQMGKDSFILSRDVVAALIRENIVDKAPTSKADLDAVQTAFNEWSRQSKRSITEISRVLSMSIES